MNNQVQLALDQFEVNRAEYLSMARGTAKALYLKTRKPVTVDDVRRECPLPEGCDARVLGGVFRGKEWVKVGAVFSNRAACHKSNRMIQYRLNEQ